MSYRIPEPEAHCYECPQAKIGNCAEYNALNRPNAPYDRGHCHWGYESIQEVKDAANCPYIESCKKTITDDPESYSFLCSYCVLR